MTQMTLAAGSAGILVLHPAGLENTIITDQFLTGNTFQ